METVEALRERAERRVPPEVPFADARRRIAAPAQQFRTGNLGGGEAVVFGGKQHVRQSGACGQPAREQSRARRAAKRRCRIRIREAQALARHLVEARGGDRGRAVAPEIAVAEVVGEDNDDVRIRRAHRARWRFGGAEDGECECEELQREQRGADHGGDHGPPARKVQSARTWGRADFARSAFRRNKSLA